MPTITSVTDHPAQAIGPRIQHFLAARRTSELKLREYMEWEPLRLAQILGGRGVVQAYECVKLARFFGMAPEEFLATPVPAASEANDATPAAAFVPIALRMPHGRADSYPELNTPEYRKAVARNFELIRAAPDSPAPRYGDLGILAKRNYSYSYEVVRLHAGLDPTDLTAIGKAIGVTAEWFGKPHTAHEVAALFESRGKPGK